MNTKECLAIFHDIASNPKKQKEKYLAAGKKIVLTAPIYTPDELIHAMGLVPMGAWGADVELKGAKEYFPAFICSIVQSITELGMKGDYNGVSAIVIPSLCDSLKVLGENWKYAVPNIPFIPMTYPQNRKPAYGAAYTKAGYERVIKDLEEITGETFDDSQLETSIAIYNEHNRVMRELAETLAQYSQIGAAERNDMFKSAFFMRKEEHTALVKDFLEALKSEPKTADKIKIMTTGILADSPSLLEIMDRNNLQIVVDDVASQSRQYRTDAKKETNALDSLSKKFSEMGDCSVLYDAQKHRICKIIEDAKRFEAKGVLIVLTKFCDPEEFDYPMIKKACEEAGLPALLIEVDRQMADYAQAETMIETFREML